jgi:hypothetical protein
VNAPVGFSRALGWLVAASNPAPGRFFTLLAGGSLAVCVFGLGAVAVAMLSSSWAALPAQARPDSLSTEQWLWLLGPILLYVFALLPVLQGGLMLLIDDLRAGRPSGPVRVLSGLQPRLFQRLAPLLLAGLAATALGWLNYRVFGGADYLADYQRFIDAALAGRVAEPPQPAHPLPFLLGGFLVNFLGNAWMLLAPAAALSGHGPLQALGRSLLAVLRHLPPLALLWLLAQVAGLALALVLGLASVMAAALAQAQPVLGALLLAAVLVPACGLAAVLASGVAYFAWRDIDGGGGTGVAPGILEA